MTPEQVAERTGKHVVTVRVAIQDKSLHATWEGVKRWQIKPDCADAWNRGEKCHHMIEGLKEK